MLPISESEWRARVCLSVIPAADTGGAASPEAWPENSNCWSCSGLGLALGWKVLALPQNPGGAKEPSPPMGFRRVSPLITRSRWRRRFTGPPRWRAIQADLLHGGSFSLPPPPTRSPTRSHPFLHQPSPGLPSPKPRPSTARRTPPHPPVFKAAPRSGGAALVKRPDRAGITAAVSKTGGPAPAPVRDRHRPLDHHGAPTAFKSPTRGPAHRSRSCTPAQTAPSETPPCFKGRAAPAPPTARTTLHGSPLTGRLAGQPALAAAAAVLELPGFPPGLHS